MAGCRAWRHTWEAFPLEGVRRSGIACRPACATMGKVGFHPRNEGYPLEWPVRDRELTGGSRFMNGWSGNPTGETET